MQTRKTEAHIERLKKLFTIHGDGVAQLKVEEALKDKQFQAAIRKLRAMQLSAPNDSESRSLRQTHEH